MDLKQTRNGGPALEAQGHLQYWGLGAEPAMCTSGWEAGTEEEQKAGGQRH